MSTSNRMPYLTATVLDQAFLDSCHDNLTCQLELAVDIEAPTGTIHVSDRNKYVGGTFYQARTKFPVISRTLGDWLSGQLEFSTIDITVNNVDGAYNHLLPSGADYDGWIGQSITVSLGLRDVASTYTNVFQGLITPVGGFARNVQSLKLTAKDIHETANDYLFPVQVFLQSDWPHIDVPLIGKGIPVIYGDWTVDVNVQAASVTCIPVNGADPYVSGVDRTVTISIANPAVLSLENHNFSTNDKVVLTTDGTLPSPFLGSSSYYVNVVDINHFTLSNTIGGTPIDTTGSTQTGTHQVKADPSVLRRNVQLVVAQHALTFLDHTQVFLHRGDSYFVVPTSELTNFLSGDSYFEVIQSLTGTWINGSYFRYADGDQFLVLCKGKDISGGLGTYDGNAVAIAKDILITFGAIPSGNFGSTWSTYMNKNDTVNYPQSAIKSIPCRLWQQEAVSPMSIANSLLEQVRLEIFLDRNLNLSINSLHFEDWVASPSYTVKNWDVERNSFNPSVDVKNNWNRAKGVYNFLPDTGENTYQTPIFRNQAAITQVGRQISKQLVFPNLHQLSDVVNQVKEMLRLAGSYLEVIETNLTWRALLLDIGGFVALNVNSEGVIYNNVPCMIRKIGYDPNGLKIPVKLWSMQMVPFPGWSPGFAGITGGSTASITQE